MQDIIPLTGRGLTVSWSVWGRLLTIVGALFVLWEDQPAPTPSPNITRNELIVGRATQPGTTASRVKCEYGPEIVLELPANKRCPVALNGLSDAPK